CPWVKLPIWLFESARSGVPPTKVESTARSFDGSRSPAVLATAVLVTPGRAPGPTVTSSVKLALSPAAIGPGFVAVRTWPPVENVHPVPAALENPSPAGSVSVHRTAPNVAAVPAFTTTIEYVPSCLTVNDPA